MQSQPAALPVRSALTSAPALILIIQSSLIYSKRLSVVQTLCKVSFLHRKCQKIRQQNEMGHDFESAGESYDHMQIV